MTSTIDPNIPATDSALTSAPIRGNFLAAYNDINGIQITLSGLGNMSSQNQNNVTITGGTIAGNGAGLTHITAANIDAGTAGIDITGNAATVTTINGRIAAGAGVSISGSGTAISPYTISASATSGTVTSVALTADSFFLTASGSPITTSGTITLSDASHPAYTLIGNPSGSIDVPTDIEVGPTLVFTGANLGTQAISGDITSSANSFVTTISNGVVTQAKMASGTANRLTGYNGSGDFSTVSIGSGLSLSGGVLSNTGAGTGDVVGPASSTDNNFASFDGTTGKIIQDSSYSASSFATAAQGSTADSALQPGDNVSELVNDAGYITSSSAPVQSVFGRTGVVTAQSGDYNTSLVTENTNLYFTDERAQDAVGAMVDSTLVYVDATPLLTRAALTGDITAAQASNATTLATVNSNVGSFGSSTSIPSFTVNGKGLITAASGNAVVAPAGTLTGTTLNSSVVTSSLTSVGNDLSMPGNPTTTTQSSSDNSTRVATTAFVTTAVTNGTIGLLDYRGSYDASTNLFPATGGSGTLGAILKGDFWICSVAGTLGGVAVTPGDLIIAIVDTPGQTAANWDLIAHDLGSYVTSVFGRTGAVTAQNGDYTATNVGLGNVTNNAQTQAVIVPNTLPSAGQILVGNAGGTAYAPVTVSGSGATISLASTGVVTISAIANASLSNSSITIAGTSTALGGSITQDTITGLGSTGLVKRTGANTLAIATSGTDYTALAFKTISVSGQSDVVADSASDTLTLAAGSNITITTDATTDTITIAASGGGGSSAFNDITSGTNTTATMVVDTGASLAASGSGTITATAAPLAGISGLGTGIATALAINTGSAGAPVLFNGAGGTPSSMTATNLTGTATALNIGGNAATVTFADAGGDTTCFVALGTSATGSLAPATDAGITYNATTNVLTVSGSVAANVTGALTGNADTATTSTNITAANEATDTTCFINFTTAATGTLGIKTNASLTFNSNTANLGCTTFTGALSGNATTATALQNARTIGGVSFDGTANIVPQTIQSINEATDTTCFPLFISASGSQSLQPLNNTSLTFNSNTGALGATSFSGAGTGLTGTGASFTAGTVTTNANLTGAITSSGNATSLGSFSSANLISALTDETGTNKAVFSTAPTLDSTVTIGTASGTTGAALFKGTTSGTVTLSVADAAGTWTMKLPTSAGSNTNVLQTDGSGNTSWVAAGAGDMTLAGVQTVTGAKTFGTIGGAVGKFILAGSTSGSTIVNAAAAAGSTTITLPGSTDTLVGLATADTLTNKRITKRVTTAADATSITPNTDSADITYQLNTQAGGTLTINADGGTPTNGQAWILKIKSTNAQTYSWNGLYISGSGTGSVTLPTTSTGSSKIDQIGFIYDTVSNKWQCVAYAPGYA